MDGGNVLSLPILEIREAMVESLRKVNRLVIQAPTGSGKSTQAPQYILDAGLAGSGQVVVLQPRRLATRMLAKRVAEERGVALGQEVGYQIRLENRTSAATRIRFVTEGLLLRQMLHDPELRGIGAIFFDEFHERHLEGDIALSKAREIQERSRPDLKIIVMSATLAMETLREVLEPCAVVQSEGRMFPVKMEYLDKPWDPERFPVWDLAAEECERLMRENPEGDALIFMSGAYEIQRTVSALQQFTRDWLILPLHGELPPEAQDAAVQRYERRKVIVSTNVAETSLTIDGVRIVVDSGFARMAKYDPHRGINTLLIEKISRASSDQRAGRAGRTAPGVCLRLWTEREHSQRAAQELPEVKRLDLAEVVLMLKAAGVSDLKTFRWIEAPLEKSLQEAERLLTLLGAIEGSGGAITETGRQMIAFPVHPRYARMFLAAKAWGGGRAVALMAALTQSRSLLVRNADKKTVERRADVLGEAHSSDFFLLMRAWRYAEGCRYDVSRCRSLGIHAQSARLVRPLFEQFLKIAEAEGLDISEKPAADELLRKCLLAGFADQLAVRLDGGTLRCALVGDRRGVISSESGVQQSPLVVASEIQEIEGKGRELSVRLSLVTAVEESWLPELFGNCFETVDRLVWDETLKRVQTESGVAFRGLSLRNKRREAETSEAASACLAEAIRRYELPLKGWDEAVEQWILRVNALAGWCPELEVPVIGEKEREFLRLQICEGAVSYKEIKDHEIWPVLRQWLSPLQSKTLEEQAPDRKELPGGRRAKIEYFADRSPTLSARIQDLYGVEGDIRIAMGRVPVTISILAPNHRPIQTTQSLTQFWRETYPKLKVELQRKYPKHTWK